MNEKVKLSYLADELDFGGEGWLSYLNKQTGKVVHLSPEVMEHVEMELDEQAEDDEPVDADDGDEYADARAVCNDEEGVFIELPSNFEIDEYSTMEKFCYSVKNEQIADMLCNAIRGSGAFRRFKDEIHRQGIEQDWYKFRDRAGLEIAREWCEANEIEYTDDRPAVEGSESEVEQLSKKDRFYRSLAKGVAALLEGERDFLANMANVAALLFEELSDVNWAGFYLLKGQDLVLGPFQGKPACTRIGPGKGVCGAAATKRETVVVANVNKFPGHIACDARSKSEIVVPLIKSGKLFGVLDVDSAMFARFDDEDRAGLEEVARLLLEGSVGWDKIA